MKQVYGILGVALFFTAGVFGMEQESSSSKKSSLFLLHSSRKKVERQRKEDSLKLKRDLFSLHGYDVEKAWQEKQKENLPSVAFPPFHRKKGNQGRETRKIPEGKEPHLSPDTSQIPSLENPPQSGFSFPFFLLPILGGMGAAFACHHFLVFLQQKGKKDPSSEKQLGDTESREGMTSVRTSNLRSFPFLYGIDLGVGILGAGALWRLTSS